MPTFQYMAKQDEIWTTVEAASCERDDDTITLYDMHEPDGHLRARYSVDIYDVVELSDPWE